MKFVIFKTSDSVFESGEPPVPQAVKKTSEYTNAITDTWYEIEIETLEDLLVFAESLKKEGKSNPDFELLLRDGDCFPYDPAQPKYALEIVDDCRE